MEVALDVFEKTARRLAEAAGRTMRGAWRGVKRIDLKGPIDLVTETDREIESATIAELREAFPDHLVVGEESTARLVRPDDDRLVWYLDPIDGTTNFAHSYPQFCFSLGMARGSEMLLGVVYDPIRDEMFVARRGAGATLNGEPIHVSAIASLDQALLGTGFPYDRREHVDFYLDFVKHFMLRAQGIRRGGSAALDLCYVACGRLDGFWEWKLKPWDVAAGSLIVAEAGGRTTDFEGASFDLFDTQTLVSNGRLHDEMRSILQARLSARG